MTKSLLADPAYDHEKPSRFTLAECESVVGRKATITMSGYIHTTSRNPYDRHARGQVNVPERAMAQEARQARSVGAAHAMNEAETIREALSDLFGCTEINYDPAPGQALKAGNAALDALVAERDALRADNQQLREALNQIRALAAGNFGTGQLAQINRIARAARAAAGGVPPEEPT